MTQEKQADEREQSTDGNWFHVHSKLPSMNDYTLACRSHWAVGNKKKQNAQQIVADAILRGLARKTLRATKEPCIVHFTWYESTSRRDCDNIASAKKFILDAMQDCGIIVNDNQRYVKGFTDTFYHGDYDGVKVELESVGAEAKKTETMELYRNHEGWKDPTAGRAIENTMKGRKQ